MDTNTIRVLSLDGGGVRGYLSLKFLQRFVAQWGINPNELWKYFDVICGTSIGGIQALAYAYGKSTQDLEPFFREKAKKVFTIRTATDVGQCDTSSESNRPNLAQKLAFLAVDTPFYKAACPDQSTSTISNYGHNVLQQVLVDNFGNDLMSDLKTNVIIPSYRYDTNSYVMHSNHSHNMFNGRDEEIVNIARATSAAPVYLPSHNFGSPEHEYIDGGVYQNNPAETALSLGKVLKPYAKRYCVMSLGTGLGEQGFHIDTQGLTSSDSAITRIFKLFDIASTGGQESVDFNMKLRANNSLEQFYYYRFQPRLSDTQNTELDNSDVAFLDYMEGVANSHYDSDTTNINNFLAHLTV